MYDAASSNVNAGNVGIHNANPTYELDVAGIVRATKAFYVSESNSNTALDAGNWTSYNQTGDLTNVYGNQPGTSTTQGGHAWGQLSTANVFTENMRLTYNGRLGIGVSAPSNMLHVADGEIICAWSNGVPSGGVAQLRMVCSNYGAFFRNDGGSFNLMSTLSNSPYGGWSTYRPFSYIMATGQTSQGGTLTIYDVNTTTTAYAGNVGIKTATPGYALTVAGTTQTSDLFINSSYTTTNLGQGMWLQWNRAAGLGENFYLNQKGTGTGGHVWGNVSNNGIYAELMRLTAGGLVGVGVVSPSNMVHAANGEVISAWSNGTTNVTSYGQFRAVNSNYGAILRNDGNRFVVVSTPSGTPYGVFNGYRPFDYNMSNGLVGIGSTVYVWDAVSSNTSNAGYVGINNPAPTADLHVVGNVIMQTTSGYSNLHIINTSAGTTNNTDPAQVWVSRTKSATSTASFGVDLALRDAYIWVNGADAINFTSNQDVVIGRGYLAIAAVNNGVSTGFASTNVPTYPLHISTTANGGLAGYGALGPTTSAYNQTTASAAISAYMIGKCVASEVNAFSDKRIKNNVVEISDDDALNVIGKIKPCSFEYIDKIQKGAGKMYGFIAQDVENIIPSAVSHVEDFIPNVFDVAIADSDIVTLKNTTTSRFDTTKLPSKVLLYDSDDVKHEATVVEIIDEKRFRVDTILSITNVFVYGSKTEDYKIVNKDFIYTFGVSAIKALDSKTNRLESTIANLENKLEHVLSRLSLVEKKFV